LRERTNALHVRALAAAGRQAEALRAAHAFRQRLADDTGLSPGAPFDALEREVALGVLSPAAPAARRSPARPSSPLVGRDHEVAAP
jgi:DNA-binding SARP family transcriptional activator